MDVVSKRLPDAAGHVGRHIHTAEPSRVVVQPFGEANTSVVLCLDRNTPPTYNGRRPDGHTRDPLEIALVVSGDRLCWDSIPIRQGRRPGALRVR
jgi:hypothetical protein